MPRHSIMSVILMLFTTFAVTAQEEGKPPRFVQPVTNPVYNQTAIPATRASAIYIYNRMPERVSIMGGGELPLGGDYQVWALQLEYAFSDTLSLIANKDGYVDFNPSEVLDPDEGFADIAAGLKWAFLREDNYAVALTGMYEAPIGNRQVWQGNGDGNINASLIGTYFSECGQVNGVLGVILPIDTGEESTMGYASLDLAWNATENLHPLIEFNWFRVLESGDGTSDFSGNQSDDLVPSVIGFEGGDLINFGGEHSDDNRDLITGAVGFSYDLCDNAQIGAAFEVPLTNATDSLMKERITVNLTVLF